MKWIQASVRAPVSSISPLQPSLRLLRALIHPCGQHARDASAIFRILLRVVPWPPHLWVDRLPSERSLCLESGLSAPTPLWLQPRTQRWGMEQPSSLGRQAIRCPPRPSGAHILPGSLLILFLRRPPPSVPHTRASFSLSWEGEKAVLLQSWTRWVTCYSSPCPIPVDPSVKRRWREEGQWVGAIQAALFSSHYVHSSVCGLEFTTCASVWCLSQCLAYKDLTAVRKPLSSSTAQLFQINPTVKSLKTPSS